MSLDLLISQFWQNLHARLQPAVPNDSTLLPGIKVVERLFLDRVDTEAGRSSVGSEYHLLTLAHTHKAGTALSFMQPAIARTQVALHSAIVEKMPVAGWIVGIFHH